MPELCFQIEGVRFRFDELRRARLRVGTPLSLVAAPNPYSPFEVKVMVGDLMIGCVAEAHNRTVFRLLRQRKPAKLQVRLQSHWSGTYMARLTWQDVPKTK
jgi:hypothetical protein